jgi:hypothetical protein
MTKGFADTAKPSFIIYNCWTQTLVTKVIIAAPLFIITLLIDKIIDRKDQIFIRSYIISIRFAIITERLHIISIRIDTITDRICNYFTRFDKYPLCTDKDSPRSKSGTYARHTKANAHDPTLHNSLPCPTLLGHTLTIGNSFRWTNQGRTANIRFAAIWA